MPVIATNEKAGGAFENAAEEILNGLLCHYEPPASTKAQKNAADLVRNGDASEILYKEQPNKLTPRKVKKGDASVAPQTEEGRVEEEVTEETPEEREPEEANETQKESKGVKWRDEESKKKAEEENEKVEASAFAKACVCIDLSFLGKKDDSEGLEDVQDEHSVVKEPDLNATPKSVLRNSGDTPKVLYDDEGNPLNDTGLVKASPFFRMGQSPISNARATPKHFDGRPDVYEPTEYNKSESKLRMQRKSTPRPDRKAMMDELQENFVERLAKLPTRTSPTSPMAIETGAEPVVAKSPATPTTPKSPRHFDGRIGDKRSAYGPVVAELVKTLSARKLNPKGPYVSPRAAVAAKSPGARSDISDMTQTVFMNFPPDAPDADDAREASADLNTNKPLYVGTRLVSAPETPKDETKSAPVIITNLPISDNRDPTPRKMKREEQEQSIKEQQFLPPTPNRTVALEEIKEVVPAGIVKKQIQATENPTEEEIPVESENTAPQEEKTKETKKSKKKKGIFSGIKKSFKNIKNVVNDIDEQRVALPKKK